MPFDGSGNFNRLMNWQNDAAANIKIKADRHDQEDDNFASGLSNVLTKDGQTQPTANIPLNGKKIINLAAPTNPTDAATKGYADSIRSFSSGTTLTGVSTGSSPNFVSTAFIGFTEADLSIVARKADNAVTPPTVDRLMLNSTANGLGPDIGPLATQTAQTRNRIVNGAMQISQENGNTFVSANSAYAVDQFFQAWSGSMILGGQRVPLGVGTRLQVSVGAVDAAIATDDYAQVVTRIEGIRIVDFRWGSASAKQVILRFGFKGPAGTYHVAIGNGTRSYVAAMTITAGQANTDTEQIFVVPGDVTGTWTTGTGMGCHVSICLAAGTSFHGVLGWQAGNFLATSAQWNGVNGANIFELFDVGLYLDPDNTGVPPKWQMPDEAEELRACQRYWQKIFMNITFVAAAAGNYLGVSVPWLVPPRTTPAIASDGSGTATNASAAVFDQASTLGCRGLLTAAAAGGSGISSKGGNANARM